jgi:phosphoglycolate phosphatase
MKEIGKMRDGRDAEQSNGSHRSFPDLTAILFDLDGTIADSRPGIFASIEFLLRQLGHTPDPTFDLNFVLGPPAEEWMKKVLGHYGDERFEEGVALYRAHQNEVGMFLSSIYPEIPDLLRGLCSRKIAIYVATAKRTAVAQRILRHFGLDSLFQSIHGTSPDRKNLDKAVLVSELLQERGLNPTKTAMLGDRKHDVSAARRNGVTGLGALWGYGSEQELRENGASFCFQAPLDVLAAFE